MASQFVQEYAPLTVKRSRGAGLSALALVIFLVAAGAWVGLKVYQGQIDGQNTQVKKDTDTLEKSVKENDYRELLRAQEAIRSAKILLDGHRAFSQIFTFLEAQTHPRARFKSFSFDEKDQIVKLSGETVDYRTLAEQIAAFQGLKEVASVSFGDLSLSDNRLHFMLELTMRPDFFKFK